MRVLYQPRLARSLLHNTRRGPLFGHFRNHRNYWNSSRLLAGLKHINLDTMTKVDKSSIVLDEVESTIRQLLLDVVDFIEKNPVPKIKDAADSQVHIPEKLARAPLELRWTGGWVRDKLLKVGSKDIDIAVNKMTGYQFGLRMKEYLDIEENATKYVIPGAKNVAKLKLHKIEANPDKSKSLETTTTKVFGLDLDLVNLRKETYTNDSRNPKIEFGTPEEDALRRDATINAMFYNIHTSLVEDFTNRGLQDLEEGIIRTPLQPYTTFIDDPLRVLRLIRFATRYGYEIDQVSQDSMASDDIKKAFLVKITRERVWQELEKMLKGPDPRASLEYFNKLGLYNVIFTEPSAEAAFKPDLENWSEAYGTVALIVAPDTTKFSAKSRKILFKDNEEIFQAWILSALVPWADAPQPPALKSGRAAPPMISTVAKEGLKAPNKIFDLLASSVQNMENIRKLVASKEYTRDVIGMAIRAWGVTWRQQVLFTILKDVYDAPKDGKSKFTSDSEILGNLTLW
jgi:tRNA nucleotidyltransferase (CCA-adding enzyme)